MWMRDFPVVGSYVTVGHSAVIHGCTIGDYSLIGMGAIILNGARIGKHCIIGRCITQNMIIPVCHRFSGKVVRQVTEAERQSSPGMQWSM